MEQNTTDINTTNAGLNTASLPPISTSPIPSSSQTQTTVLSRKPGFHLRPQPPQHQLSSRLTPEALLFQTIHMGSVTIDPSNWHLVLTGLVARPYALTLAQLKELPRTTIAAFHECFGSPISPPTTALWRVGNVEWTGVRLATLLAYAQPLPSASYVWSSGLDAGEFAGVSADSYQKDVPMGKALAPEVLVAYAMNGEPLGRERGGPVRLVVPGWFGTNSTKWLCRLEVREKRAPGPYTTRWYNREDPRGGSGALTPVWEVDVNSMITTPEDGAVVQEGDVLVEGWAWSADEVVRVGVSTDGGQSYQMAVVESRYEFSWQKFSLTLVLGLGEHVLIAQATSKNGTSQALSGYRNHVHSVNLQVCK
ncbi:molybdopterin binding oxidoreductase [Pyrenochaeta sp. DS3sAY3a]|nr:molybdopterin binding oxidoreductase [Pyrenochaeta sp. DS3sAY3a]